MGWREKRNWGGREKKGGGRERERRRSGRSEGGRRMKISKREGEVSMRDKA